MCAIDGLHCAVRTMPLEEVLCYYDHRALEVSAEEASVFISIWHTVLTKAIMQ